MNAVLARPARELLLGLPSVHVARSRYAPAELEAARVVWAGRIVDEHRSVVVFAELLRCLAEIDAPFAAIASVTRLVADELRHATLCADVARALGGIDDLEIDLVGLGLPPDTAHDPVARAREIVVRELVVAERESVTVLAAYRDAASDPAIARVLSCLLLDEARHAATGVALQALLDARFPPSAEETARLAQVAARDMLEIRATYEASASDGPGRALGASLRADELRW